MAETSDGCQTCMPIIVVRHWPDLRAENPDEHAKATDAQAGRSNESTTGADDAATSWNELTESWDAASDSPHATAARSDEAVGRSDEGAESADESAGSADDWLSVKPDGRNLWTRLRILRTPERGGGRPCGFERTGRRELRILRTCRCQRRPGRACGKCGFGVRKSPDYAPSLPIESFQTKARLRETVREATQGSGEPLLAGTTLRNPVAVGIGSDFGKCLANC